MLYIIVGDKTKEIQYDNILNTIRQQNPGIQERFFDANQNESSIFMEAIQTNSMFGGKQLLVLKRAEETENLTSFFKTIKLFNLDSKEIIIDIEKKGNIFGKKAQKIAEEIGKLIIVKSQNEDETVIEFIKRELNIDNRQAFSLKEMIGTNVQNVKNEIEKIKNYLDGSEFDIDKIKNIISIKEEYNIFEVVDKTIKGNKKEGLKYIENDGNTHLFLYNLSQEIKNILKLKLLIKQGKIKITNNFNSFNSDFNRYKKYFKKGNTYMHPYGIFKKLDKINIFEIDRLKKLLILCHETEYKIKNGYGDDKILIELLIMKF
jgi:DNA polymerase-3 subunit delta